MRLALPSGRATLAALAAAFGLLIAAPAAAADAKPPADPSRPATTVRVGGSPADAEFRDANEKAHARYRDALASCRARPAAQRSACVRDAKAELRTAQRVAKATHGASQPR